MDVRKKQGVSEKVEGSRSSHNMGSASQSLPRATKRSMGSNSSQRTPNETLDGDGSTEEEACVICMNPLDSARVTELGCKHKFHTECLLMSVNREGELRNGAHCPLCRSELAPAPSSGGPAVASAIATQSSSQDAMDEDEEIDVSRCIYADCQGLPANRQMMRCAGHGCSVWGHRDCVRRHLSGGSRSSLPRLAYCETCLTQSPELADNDHVCLNPSEERDQAYAAEHDANQSNEEASTGLLGFSSLPVLSSCGGVVNAWLGHMEDDAKSDSGSSYVASEFDAKSTVHSAARRTLRSGGSPQRDPIGPEDHWTCTRAGCLHVNKPGVLKCQARECQGDRSVHGLKCHGSATGRQKAKPKRPIVKKLRKGGFRNTAERVDFVKRRLLKKANEENIIRIAKSFGIKTTISFVPRSLQRIATLLAVALTGTNPVFSDAGRLPNLS